MANFNKAGSAKAFENVKKVEQEKANVEVIRNIRIENLVPNPKNNRDVSYTKDIENSIEKHGFISPLVVTDFGMEEGKCMIIAGHRRTKAAQKMGMEVLPCKVIHFDNEVQMNGYTRRDNLHRENWEAESQKWVNVFELFHQYEDEGFEGDIKERLAEDFKTTVSTIYRWLAMQRVIKPVWNMVDDGFISFSTVQPMAKLEEDEQNAIYNIMQEAIGSGVDNISKSVFTKIMDGYKGGKATWAEIADMPRDSGLPLNGFMNTEPTESREPSENGNRNDEVRHDADPIGAEYDKMDADREAWERQQEEAAESEADSEQGEKEEKHQLSPEEKQMKLGEDFAKLLHKADGIMQEIWKCKDNDSARDMIILMGEVGQAMIDEMYRLGSEHDMEDEANNAFGTLKSAIGQYI